MTNEQETTGPQPCATCQGKGYVPVRVPVTSDMEADAGMEPGSGGYVTEGEPCMDCHTSGEATQPTPPQTPEELAAAIREATNTKSIDYARAWKDIAIDLAGKLGTIAVHATRLAALLAERDAKGADCGCNVNVSWENSGVWDEAIANFKAEITYCPMHAAATDMLAALREVLAEVPSMQWLIEQGGLTNEQAPRYARVIGDAYVLLERIDTAAAARGGAA